MALTKRQTAVGAVGVAAIGAAATLALSALTARPQPDPKPAAKVGASICVDVGHRQDGTPAPGSHARRGACAPPHQGHQP